MKTSLSHLPKYKKNELKAIVRIIREVAEPEMIILFGSYAKGTWVEDSYLEGHITYEYKSDYDLLIVFEDAKKAANIGLKNKIERAIRESGEVETRISIIMHSVQFLNKKISIGSYFFTDIKKEGIMLYSSKRHRLSRTKKLNEEERKKHALEDFEHWFESGSEFYEGFEFYFNKAYFKNAAFLLHQAAERFYMAILLVFTGYKPKTHDIEELGKQASNLDSRFSIVFSKNTKEQQRLFDLLQKAYIDARYKKDYVIIKEELEYLANCVETLKRLTEQVCKEKIGKMVRKESKSYT